MELMGLRPFPKRSFFIVKVRSRGTGGFYAAIIPVFREFELYHRPFKRQTLSRYQVETARIVPLVHGVHMRQNVVHECPRVGKARRADFFFVAGFDVS